MRILYLDCFAGISGDMFISVLLDLGLKIEQLKKELEKLNLGQQFSLSASRIKYNGISAVQFRVREDKHVHRSLQDIKKIIQKSQLAREIKLQVICLFEKLYQVEKKIHREVHHFHELGLLDTIIDVVSVITGLKLLGIEKVYASKVNVGSGFVKTHHGLLPVPAPAAAELLKGVPIYSQGPEMELVTPTGALLLSEFVSEFRMPDLIISKIGYGAGTKKTDDFPNLLRAFLGEVSGKEQDKVLIETNIDDLNPQLYEYVMEQLFLNGALDVYMTPVYMKKNRPGIILSCIANNRDQDKLVNIIFKETSTIGLRISHPQRIELEREKRKIKTKYGEIEVKIGRYKDRIINISPEYADCKKLAEKKGVSLKELYHQVYKSIK